MKLKNRVLVFDAQSMRFEDWNGHLRVEHTNLTKANICEYYGAEISNYQKYGLKPDKKYRFYRSPDELNQALPSFKERPILYVHKAADADHLDNSKVIGTTGSDPQFNPPYVQCSITIWDGDYIQAIKDNRQKELSASYAFVPQMTPGNVNGEPYDGVMTRIHVDHIALVQEGRAGSDVRVADEKFKPTFKGKKMPRLNTIGKRVFTDLVVLINRGRANDSNAKDIADVIGKATKTRKSMFPQVVSSLLMGYSIANDEEIKKIEETVNKAMDEECRAKDDDDPVDTLEAKDEEEKDKKTATEDEEEEENKKKKQDEASTKDEDPEQDKDKNKAGANDRKPNINPSMPSQQAQVFDAAAIEKTIKSRVMEDMRKTSEARELVKPLVGEWASVGDSGEYILSSALEQVMGVKIPPNTPYETLQLMAKREIQHQAQNTTKANDSVACSAKDLQRFNATRLRSI
ncbi:DUF2213 domain-containing protein [Commensalibacter sp. Nvir]|uniref:DUF2213 domain-containing protein n=1 Tax=Commensalibacter sp. Nvir TaxID=3069817 RepID=UPI0030C89408